MLLTPASVTYLAQLILTALTAGFLLWRSRQPDANVRLLRLAAAIFATTTVLLAALWADSSLHAPWALYARFFVMSLVAALALPLFALLYHLPEWEPGQQREFQIVALFLVARLLYELYWGGLRSLTLAREGLLIDRRPLLADLLALLSLLWLMVTLARRLRHLQRRSGHFIVEAMLLLLCLVPPMLAQLAFSAGWITRPTMELVRDLSILVTMPLMVLVFLELLPEAITLLIRLLSVSLVVALTAVSATAVLLGPLLADAQAAHYAMFRLSALTLVITLLVLVGVPLLLKRSVLRPLDAMLAGVRQVDAGDLSVVVPVTFADEIGLLTTSFNRMVGEVREMVAGLETRVQERTAELARSEARYRGLVETSPDLFFRISRDGIYLDVHAPQEDLLLSSLEQLPGQRLAATLPAAVVDQVQQASARALDTGAVQTVEYGLPLAHGERWFEARIVRCDVDEVSATVRDITERREAEAARRAVEQRLLEAQRLESLGVLAGGIAHDYNNILTAVLGHTELALADPVSPTTRSHLEAIGTGARRAAELTAQILAYAGRGRIQSRPVVLPTLIREAQGLIVAAVGSDVEVRYDLGDDDAPVVGDPGQLRQLVLNVVTNASEALGASGGLITLGTAVEQLTEERLERLTLGREAQPGEFVRLSVRDTGEGMDETTLARVFDPFFSTKFTGRGLGLAAVHGIVRGHRGAISVESVPGQGTVLQVWLPITRSVEPGPHPGAPITAASKGGVVLVVDDEAGVRLIVRRLLEREGYTVVEAPGGAEAIALLEAGIPGLSGVLLDLTMPGVPSEDVSRRLHALAPAVPLMLISGYSQEELATQQKAFQAVGWIQKPFSGTLLRARVRQAFGAPTARQGSSAT
jgi:PAS domain S-box-containing protein